MIGTWGRHGPPVQRERTPPAQRPSPPPATRHSRVTCRGWTGGPRPPAPAGPRGWSWETTRREPCLPRPLFPGCWRRGMDPRGGQSHGRPCAEQPLQPQMCVNSTARHVNITACPLWRRATFCAAWPVVGPRRGKRVTRARQRRRRHSRVTVTGVLLTRRSAWPRVPPSQTGGLAWRGPLTERPRAPIVGAPAVAVFSRWRFDTARASGGDPQTPRRGTRLGRSYFPPRAPSGPATQTLRFHTKTLRPRS